MTNTGIALLRKNERSAIEDHRLHAAALKAVAMNSSIYHNGEIVP